MRFNQERVCSAYQAMKGVIKVITMNVGKELEALYAKYRGKL